jgi:hypothetical protein
MIYPNNRKKENSLTETERLIINSLAQEIKDYGGGSVWDTFNTLELGIKMDYIELYFSALNLLKNEEY